MPDKWFISDTHLFHENILKFRGKNGELIRPGFADVNEMNERIAVNWNKRIAKGDKVYHVGDVAFGLTKYEKELMELLGSLNGQKTLIIGNHDPVRHPVLWKNFYNIELWKGFGPGTFTCSHIPLRLDSLRDGKFNVHGHIHEKTMDDPRYINVCVEHTDYSPIHYDEIMKIINDRSS